MKVESLRILSKKRKQSQRADNGAASSPGGNTGKGVKRALPGSTMGGDTGRNRSANPPGCDTSSGAMPRLGKTLSGGTSPGGSSGSSNSSTKDSQRRRFVWSEPLHQDFVAAVFDIGLKCASPKLLLEMMPVVDGLTSEHIKSHLQKYRLHRQRSREEFLKSYGYLTDLDGGKGLGGGSAAAAIKAAAAAAGDVKGAVPLPAAEVSDEGGCGTNCACDDGSQSVSGGEGGERETPANATGMTTRASKEAKNLPKAGSEISPVESNTGSKCDAGDGEEGADTEEATARSSNVGMVEESASPQPQETASAAMPVVTGGLLQAHLELLAKGIDMQIKFHHHLREVVNSQRALQMQLLGQRDHDRRSDPKDIAKPTLPGTTVGPGISATGMKRLSANHTAVRGKVYQMPKEGWTMGGAVMTAGAMVVPEVMQSAAVDGQANEAGGKRDKSPAQVGGRAGPVKTGERIGAPLGGTAGGMNPQTFENDSSPAVAPLVASASPATIARPNTVDADQQVGATTQRNPTTFQATSSARPDVGGGPERLVTLGQSVASAVGRRSYIPGEYTLNFKGSDAAGAGSPHMRGIGVGLGGAQGVLTARSSAEARMAFSTAKFAQVAPTAAVGQDPRSLQRHMQAQMEMQRTMLEACVDQATLFGAQRTWNDNGVVPVQVAALGGGDSAGATASAQESGRGEAEGGGTREEGNATAVPRDQQGTESTSVEHADQGDNMLMGFLPTEDAFSFDWLDRGELQHGDSAAPPRATGETQSLFSFLMD